MKSHPDGAGEAFAGLAPPAAVFYFSRNRTAEHPKRHLAAYSGILQADAYAGFGDLYLPGRKPGPITEAACWAHFRRKVSELAEVAARRWPPRPCAALTGRSRQRGR